MIGIAKTAWGHGSMLRNFGFAFFLAVPSPVTSELGPDATAVNPPRRAE